MLSKAMLTSGLPSAIHSAALGAGCWRLLAAATGSRHLATDDSNKSPGVVGKVKEGMGKVAEKVGQAFQETGAVGHQFTPEGAAGGTAKKMGGPFTEGGAVGSKFTTEGPIGGTVEAAAEATEEKGKAMKHDAHADQATQGAKDTMDEAVQGAKDAYSSAKDTAKDSV